MSCPACGGDGVVSEFTPGGIVRKCADCKTPVGAVDQKPAAPVAKAEPKPSAPRPPEKPRNTSPRTVIRDARARAAELRRSIKAHERALANERRELTQLTRLLDAAADQPRAVVRPIRTTA